MVKKEIDRVVSFSYTSKNTEAIKNIKHLKTLSVNTGVSFSFLVLSAINNYVKDGIDGSK